jgi:AcrR family transcriptional regulator
VKAPARKQFQRARSDEAKQQRRDAILAAARDLFPKRSYAAITVESVARACRLTKGTVYLYFPSKEAIFLELLLDELERWFAALTPALDRIAAGDAPAVANLLAVGLSKRPTLRRLLAMLHATLEQNIGHAAVRAYKLRVAAAMAPTAVHLERRLPRLAPGDGARLLVHLHALVVGVGQVSDNSEVVREVLAEPALAALRVDFVSELRELLVCLLAGWEAGAAARKTG